MKTLVLYVFHEYNKRVEFFFRNALFYDENIDFIIIANDKTLTFNIPVIPNIKVLFRDNIGYDFGAWSHALLNDNLYINYDYFIFLNSSMVGPFLPVYYKHKWTTIFIEGLQNNIKLFGSTINTYGDPKNKSHVQSCIFSMDKTTLEHLISSEIFTIDYYNTSKGECIEEREVRLSREIIKKGWNIGCLIPMYKDVDFTFSTKSPEEYNIRFVDDVLFQCYNDAKVWTEKDLVFIKGNRDLIEALFIQ